MRIAHLILAHGDPKHLERLVKRLQHPKADFFIHIDNKVSMEAFNKLEYLGQLTFVRPRVNIIWGGYSMVEATLNGIECILQTNRTYDYINLLSGQDYPLQDIYFFHEFLKNNPGKVFTEYKSVDNEWLEAKPRVKNYYFTNTPFPGNHFLEKIVSAILPPRRLPYKFKAYGKSQWFTMSILHANYISDFLLDYKKYENFFRYTWGADEIFFQTLLCNSDYKTDLVNDNLRYIDWAEGKPSPKVLTIQDAESMIKSGKYFARKFSTMVDTKILDYLDEQAAIQALNRPFDEDEEQNKKK